MLKPSTTAAINRFRKAVEEHAFLGAQPPEDHAEIKRNMVMAEAQLARAIAREKMVTR